MIQKNLLFDFQGPRSTNNSSYEIFGYWTETNKPSFSSAVLMSFILHSCLFVFLILSVSHSSTSPSERVKSENYKALVQAFSEIGEGQEEKDIGPILPSLSEKEVQDIMEAVSISGLNIGQETRVEFYKKLLQSALKMEISRIGPEKTKMTWKEILAFLSAGGEITLDSGNWFYPQDPSLDKKGLNYRMLSRERKEKLNEYLKLEEQEESKNEYHKERQKINTSIGTVYVPEEYLSRKSPFEQILAQGADVFNIVSGFPSFEEKTSSIEKEQMPGETLDAVHSDQKRGSLKVTLIESENLPKSKIKKGSSTIKEPLVIYNDEGKAQKILDDLMAYPEDEQLLIFQERYLTRYNLDEGDLPRLTKEFIYNNLSNIIIVSSSTSGAFGFIEQLFYGKKLAQFYQRFWHTNPWTETGLEFLYCLASLYDFEKRALAYIFNAYDAAKLTTYGYFDESKEHNKLAEAYVIMEIYEELMHELNLKGYKSEEEILDKYVQEQKKIYNMIIANEEKEKNRALFALGRLLFNKGQYESALEEWKRIDGSYSAKTYKEIKKVMTQELKPKIMHWEIKRIFSRENHETSQKLLERLSKYSRWEKREGLAEIP